MSTTAYQPSIDGLRAIAVVGVIFYHFEIGFPGGYVGVDVFFVISGYLITQTILKRQAQRRFTLGEFWFRRIRRVLPALAALVLATLVAGYFILIPSEYLKLSKSAIASTALSANVHFWQIANYGYFSDFAGFNPLLHIWSLAIEEQFYILLPLVFFLSEKLHLPKIPKILLFTGVASFGLSCWAATHAPSANFFLLPTRAWELVAGCLLAFHCPNSSPSRLTKEMAASSGILLIILTMAFYNDSTRFPGWTAIPPILGTSLFIYANHAGKTVIGRALSTSPVVFLGLISYSLYLWHWPVLSFSKHVLIEQTQTSKCILLCSVLFIAVVSWRYIEQPFLRISAVTGRPKLLSLALGSCLLSLTLSWIIIWQKGFTDRFTLSEQQLQADFSTPAPNIDDDYRPLPFGDRKAGKLPILALWGDSHAACMIPVFDKHCREKQIPGIAFVRGSSIPVPGVFTDGERSLIDYNQDVKKFISSHTNIRHVILAARWSSYIDGRNIAEIVHKPPQWKPGLMEPGDQLEKLSRKRSIELLGKHLKSMASEFSSRGITVWLIEQVPETDNFFTAREFYLHKKYPDLNPMYRQYTVSMADHLDRQENARAAIASIADDLITVIDPTPSFFERNDRLQVSGERAYYRDDNHLTPTGAMHYLDDPVGHIIREIAGNACVSQ